MKILFYTYPNIDYGLDTLYDGLCRVLGAENVFDYPIKPTLHGDIVKKYAHFPMYFGYPEKDIPNDFDVILVSGRVVRDEFFEIIKEKSKTIPTFIVDMTDFNAIDTDLMEEVNARLYFKREYWSGTPYEIRITPLSFSYSEKYIPKLSTDRPDFIFWAGKGYSKRYRYINIVEELVKDLPHIIHITQQRRTVYNQKEYSNKLSSSKVALHFKGYGWDTIRYCEVPAHGTLLFAKSHPLVIENDFTDGENAVYFYEKNEMKEKLKYMISHPDYVDKIRIKGYEHFLKYHTSTKRAEQMLGKIRAVLRSDHSPSMVSF